MENKCLKEIIHNAFQYKNSSIRYTFITSGYHTPYFVKCEQYARVFIDNIFVEFGSRLFQ